ncbi:MAG TPA: DUF6775 family putative metallopeptidase [Planctomycetota bacterium]|nr:DUF6775 family putative metallopeptidase [Planctomycetota bacterium]
MLSHVSIHGWPPPADIDLDAIAHFLRELLGGIVRVGPPLAVPPERLNDAAEAFAQARVFNPMQPLQDRKPLPMEVEYEKRRLTEPSDMRTGIVYDGFAFSEIAAGLLGESVRRRSSLHIVFTDQLVGTLDPNDRRYHARTAVFSVPVVVSSAGLVQAPARPRGYYLAKHALRLAGKAEGAEALLGTQSAGRWLERGDPRMTDIAKGYAAQAAAFQLWGHPFCGDPACRLFNAHRQDEMIRAQLGGPDFCEKHAGMFRGG